MAVAPAAAAEGSVAALFAIGLLALLAWFVLRGLLAGYEHSLGYVLARLAGILRINVRFVHFDFGGPIRALDNAIRHTLSAGASRTEALAGRLFHGAALIQEWTVRELAELAHETLAVAQHLQHVHLPKNVKALLLAAFPPALLAKLVADAVRKYGVKVVHTTTTIVHRAAAVTIPHVTIPYIGQWQWLRRHWKALVAALAAAAALPGAIRLPHVNVLPRLRSLERRAVHDAKRLRRLEKLLGVAAFAALMAKVLGLPNWRCLTRGNIGRTARVLCGLDAGILGALLAGLGFLALPLSIEALGREFLAVEEDVLPLVVKAVSELEGIAA